MRSTDTRVRLSDGFAWPGRIGGSLRDDSVCISWTRCVRCGALRPDVERATRVRPVQGRCCGLIGYREVPQQALSGGDCCNGGGVEGAG